MKKTLCMVLTFIFMMVFSVTSLGFSSVAVKSIKLNTVSISLQAGKTYTLKAIFTPKNATNQKLTYSSKDKNIATVDKSGKIMGIKAGKTVITVTSTSNKKAIAKCNVTVTPIINALKDVKLKMYLLGDKPADTDLIYAEVNKKLKKDINATLEVNFLSWAEYNQKYPLIFASGEDFDLVYAASWVFYTQQAIKDAFMALNDDMLKKYAPITYKEVPKEGWEQSRVNGKIYMIPTSYKGYLSSVAILRGDLRQKYNLPEIKSVDDVEKYLSTIADKEKDLIPWADMNSSNAFRLSYMNLSFPNSYLSIGGGLLSYYKGNEKTGKVITPLDEEYNNQLTGFYKKMADWYKRGFWSKSALTTKGGAVDQLKAGKGAFAADNYTNVQATIDEINKNHPDWKPEAYDLNFSKNAFVNSYLSDGMCIHATSKNPERSLMLIDLFRNNPTYFDLTTYGIKGKHYDLTTDGKLLTGPDAKNYPADYACPWGWKTLGLYRQSANTSPQLTNIMKSFASRATVPSLVSFTMNNENVKAEYAACREVFTQYEALLDLGMDENYVARQKEYLDKLKAAGYEKFITELKRQVAEYLKALGK